jgi:hypothetical protein
MSSHTETIESTAMLDEVLSGALRLWEVAGAVEAGEDGWLVTVGEAAFRVVPRPPHGWRVLRGADVVGEHAGVPGLLRQLRDELAPHARRGRLIMGAQ